MKNLIPHLIYNNYKDNNFNGCFDAVTMFIDISGFTAMTERLMKEGKEGAEILSIIINNVFSPLIDSVYDRGGFVSGFAGDAFTAIFPVEDENKTSVGINGCYSALFIKDVFEKNGNQKTRFGNFNLSVKVGLSYGNVYWGIVGLDKYKTYYFKGDAIDGCANSEHKCSGMDIVLDKKIISILPKKSINIQYSKCEPKNKKDYACLTEVKGVEDKIIPYKDSILEKDILLKFLPDKIFNHIGKVGELRDIVSIFISFKEYQTLGEMGKFVGFLLEGVDKWGGYVKGLDFGDKGNTILIIFGAPISYENDMERAVNFLLEIKEKYNNDIKAGITYGTVYSGIIGNEKRCSYDVLGDVVNLSSRFMTGAEWGRIWISRNIKTNIEDKYEINKVGEKIFKGKSQAENVFELINKKQTEAEKIYRGEMVGRKSEVNQIKENLKKLDEQKFSGIIYLYGDAGIGKSRLAYEVIEQIKDKVKIYITQTDSILRKSMNPFINILKDYFNQTNSTNVKEKETNFKQMYEKLISGINNIEDKNKLELVKPLLEELNRTQCFIKALLELDVSGTIYEDLDPKGRFENTIYAIKEFFKAQSLIQPIIILIEDIQWLDEDSNKVMQVLTRNIESFPISIISTGRYNDDGSKPAFKIDSDVYQDEIVLKGLDIDYAKIMVKEFIGKNPDEKLLSFIKEKTENNPFYIEQFCLYLIENDLLEYKNDEYTFKGTLEGVPKGVNAILIARIDRLSAELKELVQISSVFGKEFDTNVLTEIMNISGEIIYIYDGTNKLGGLLSEGIKQNIWRKISDIRYTYKNTLISETAYDMQLRVRLRNFHKISAEAIEKLYKNEPTHYSEIAYHYEKAEIDDKAKEYLEKAGNYSKETYENDNAINLYQRLLKYCNDEEKININAKICEIYDHIGKWKEAEEIFRENINKLINMSNNKQLIAYNKSRLGGLLHNKGNYQESTSLLYSAYALYKELNDKEGIGYTLGQIGIVYNKQSNFEKAMEYYQKRLSIARELNDKQSISNTIGNIGIVYRATGKLDKAMESYQEQLKIAEEIGDKLGISKAIANIGVVYHLQSNYNKAMEYYQKQLDLSTELGNRLNIGTAIGNMGIVYYNQGNYNQAIECYQKQMHLAEELGNKIGLVSTLNNLGVINYYLGNYSESISSHKKSLKIAEELKNKQYIIYNLVGIASSHKKLKDYETAKEFYGKAIEDCTEPNTQSLLCEYLYEKADICFIQNQIEEANSINNEALKIAKETENQDFEFNCEILNAKIVALNNKQKAIEEIETVINKSKDNEDIQAKAYYELFKMTNSNEPKEKSLNLYRSLYEKLPQIDYKEKVDELS